MLFNRKKRDVVIASPLIGKITLERSPVGGATVKRHLKWKGSEEQQEAHTDSQGGFSFTAVVEKMKHSPLETLVISQDLLVVYQGEERVVFSASIHQHGLFSEFGGEPKDFACELTRDDIPVRKDGVLILTSCTWEGYLD